MSQDVNLSVAPLAPIDASLFADSTVASPTLTAASQQFAIVVPNPSNVNATGEFTADVLNVSGGICYVNFYSGAGNVIPATVPGTTPATAGSYPIANNERRSFTLPAWASRCAVIGTGTPTGPILVTTAKGGRA